MGFMVGLPLTLLADATTASNAMRTYLTPVIGTIIAIASLAVVFFLVNGGYHYMTSSGNPEKLEHAKKVIRNALIGLVMVVAAGTLTAILSHAYTASGGAVTQKLPALVTINVPGSGVTDVLLDAITGFLRVMVESGAKPFLAALSFFTTATPLMADNSGVFNLWLTIVGISDVLFVLVVALLGFHVMSYATFGLDEIEFKHLLPRIGLVFLLANSSIFLIDGVISLSNGMISALNAGFSGKSVWDVLTAIVDLEGGLGLVPLLIMVVFLVLSVMLVVYYVLRLVVLYIGAVLSPLVFLLWLLPGCRDFAESAMKTYLTTIFVLFIHVVILHLAATLLAGIVVAVQGQSFNPLMSTVVGIATVLALLKAQGVMSHMSYVSLGPKTASKLGGQLSNVISHYNDKRKARNADERPEGLSRGGAAASGRSKRIFYESGSSVVRGGSNNAAGARSTKIQMNAQANRSPRAPKAPRNSPPQTRVAPNIGKAVKK
ncbi:MAG TPA: pilin [Patescibacteria group bacterium]|nr:pilin [Patescibacteria group bacterium]